MAATTHDLRRDRRNGSVDRRVNPLTFARPLNTEGIRVSWGGIWGGVLTALGIVLLLGALGMAVGITATDPARADGAALGMAAGIWAGVSLLVALFVGGMVSTRIGATFDGATGFWEGALVWIVTLLSVVYLATTSLSSLMGGATRLMGAASQTMATAMQGAPAAMATTAAWATFGALVLTLLAAVLGAVSGRRRHPFLERR